MSLSGKKILLGVTGGIAAYKAVLLLRLLKKANADVKVVMTPAATEFVGPITFESLSENPVHVNLWETGEAGGTISPVEHIDIAKWPDAVVVVPATANSLAGFVHGRADDLLATIVSAYDGAVFLAPAMNDVMWESQANQDNMRALSNAGFRVVPPEHGDLACGYEATGRMAEPETILAALQEFFAGELAGKCVLVTAGGTEEDIDPVRTISNRSSGKMGFAVARAARDMGAQVVVVAARTTAVPPHGVRILNVRTSQELASAVGEAFDGCDILVMAAAVSDFKPAKKLSSKHKGDALEVSFTRTEDILAGLGARKADRKVVGFALETDDVEANALAKMNKKSCDLMVLNNPNVEGATFAHNTNVVTIYNAQGKVYESQGPESKQLIAREIMRLAASL